MAISRSAPVSNVERQRQFRERNPGYYGRLHRKRKAEALALAAHELAAQETALPAPATLLMLPAPVESNLFDFATPRERELVEAAPAAAVEPLRTFKTPPPETAAA